MTITRAVPQFEPVDGYDYGEYRYVVTAIVKFLIRLRTKAAGSFLSSNDYKRWDLANIEKDPEESIVLVRRLNNTVDRLWREFIDPYESGGIYMQDPFDSEKRAVIQFVAQLQLWQLGQDLGNPESVNWDEIANWDFLPTIRDWLDRLPHPARGHRDCPIQIGNNESMEILVSPHATIIRLRQAQFNVIQTLVQTFPLRLSLDELRDGSGHQDARNVLRRLSDEYTVLRTIILMSGTSRKGYGLLPLSEVRT